MMNLQNQRACYQVAGSRNSHLELVSNQSLIAHDNSLGHQQGCFCNDLQEPARRRAQACGGSARSIWAVSSCDQTWALLRKCTNATRATFRLRLLANNMVDRVLVMRHAHRYTDTYTLGDDPQLTPKGLEQAQQVAALLADERIDGIFTSPWLRAIQTAAPLAAAKGLQLHVDRCLGEYLQAEGGHFDADPLPHLAYELRAAGADLPHVPAALLAEDGGSPLPPFPEDQASTLARHREALQRVFAAVGAIDAGGNSGTVLIVGHGASNDFCIHALCGEGAHPTGRYSRPGPEPLPPPPHCCLTTIRRKDGADDSLWEVEGYGHPTVTTDNVNSSAATPRL
jgi:broad specificity phosphatase PhoE